MEQKRQVRKLKQKTQQQKHGGSIEGLAFGLCCAGRWETLVLRDTLMWLKL